MLERHEKDIDAVCIATPDHTHYCCTIDAMRRGKHVFVEKPLTHTFRESELLMRAAEKYGVVNQMGNQGHTSVGASQFQQLVKARVMRDIVRIDAFMQVKPKPDHPHYGYINDERRLTAPPEAQPIPENLDWDSWCGPRELLPYNSLYHPRSPVAPKVRSKVESSGMASPRVRSGFGISCCAVRWRAAPQAAQRPIG